MHPQLRIIFVAVTAVFAAVACSSIDNVSSAIQPAHASVPAAKTATAKAPVMVAAAVAAPVATIATDDIQREVPYARPDLSPDPEERKAAVQVQIALAGLKFIEAHRLATTPALKELVQESIKAQSRERNPQLAANLLALDNAAALAP
jgi:hypothetical protein